MYITSGIALALGILVLYLAISSELRWTTNQAQTVPGVAISKEKKWNYRTGDVYLISYRFNAQNGQVKQGRAFVDLDYWEETTQGGPISVQYIRDDPGDNRISGQHNWTGALIGSMLGVAGAVGLLVDLARHLRPAKKRHRAKAHKGPAPR